MARSSIRSLRTYMLKMAVISRGVLRFGGFIAKAE
jgi:hypothetical protein